VAADDALHIQLSISTTVLSLAAHTGLAQSALKFHRKLFQESLPILNNS